MLKGIDYSVGGGVTAVQVKDAGYSFVCRYLSGHERINGVDKDVSAAEVTNYHAAGIALVFNWETSGTDMTSFANGVADARAAQAELENLAADTGQPSIAQAPVVFSADEATEADMTDYMKGVASVIGKARTGIYGGYATVKAAFDQGLVAYGWQTFAWSNGQWDDRALIRQLGSVTVGPAQCDLDEAAFWASATKILSTGDDFGQWPRPSAAQPLPMPQVTGLQFTAVNTFATAGYITASATWNPVNVPGASYQGEIYEAGDPAGTKPVLVFQVTAPEVSGVSLKWSTKYAVRVQPHPMPGYAAPAFTSLLYLTTPGPYAG